MSSATAVIVGGGAIGLSTAYHLAKMHAGRIILLEKGEIGDGSSSRSAGIITGLLWNETGVLARKISLNRFREMSEELDGYQFHTTGCLNLFDAESWPARAALLPLYDRLDMPYEVLDATEIHRRWPDLHPDPEWIGLYDPLGGYSEPDEYLPALTSKCRKLGVEIRENTPVSDFILRGGRIVGVRTATDRIEAESVICTAYSWTNALFAQLGMRMPVKAFVHQRYVTQSLPHPLHFPVVNANPLGGYIRPASHGRLMLGVETAEREEYRVTSTDFRMSDITAASELKEHAHRTFSPFLPALRQVDWAHERLGLLTFSMDGEPLLGPFKQLPGVYTSFAFHSGGFAYGPAVGLFMAEMVRDGHASIDLSIFAPDRFTDRQAVDSYLAQTLPQKTTVQRRH